MVKTGATGKIVRGFKDIAEDVIASVDNTFNLGSASKRWATLFVVIAMLSSIVIGGTVKLTTTDFGLIINDSTQIQGNLTVDRNLLVKGNLTVLGEETILNVTTLSINGTMQPFLDDTFDLGTTSLRWKDLFLSGNVTADFFKGNGIQLTNINVTLDQVYSATGLTGGGGNIERLINVDEGDLNWNLSEGFLFKINLGDEAGFKVFNKAGDTVFSVNRKGPQSIDWIPFLTSTYDLGTSAKRWNDLYLSGTFFSTSPVKMSEAIRILGLDNVNMTINGTHLISTSGMITTENFTFLGDGNFTGALFVNSAGDKFSQFGPSPISLTPSDTKDAFVSVKNSDGSTLIRAGLIIGEYDSSTDSSTLHLGLNSFFYHLGTGNYTGTQAPGQVGGRYAFRVRAPGTTGTHVTITRGGAVSAQANIQAASNFVDLTDGYAFLAEGNVVADAGSTFTNSYNFWGKNFGSAFGTVTNNMGFIQEELTDGATTNIEFGVLGKGIFAFIQSIGTQPTEFINSNDTGHLDLDANTNIDFNIGGSEIVTINKTSLILGSSSSSLNLTMFSPDGSSWSCGVNNTGVWKCS